MRDIVSVLQVTHNLDREAEEKVNRNIKTQIVIKHNAGAVATGCVEVP